jgi:hypothetical protein
MNPLTGVTTIIGSLAGILGMGGAVTQQAMTLHRQIHPPQQQMQAQAQPGMCPVGYKPIVIVKPTGERVLACIPQQEQP